MSNHSRSTLLSDPLAKKLVGVSKHVCTCCVCVEDECALDEAYSKENNPEQPTTFGERIDDLSPMALRNWAHWAARLNDAIWGGEFDCGGHADCVVMTSNGRCHGCMHGKSPAFRAEFAEDLVNRVAFAHGCDLMGQYDQTDIEDAAARLANNGWAWPLCATDTCPFCDAAREVPEPRPTVVSR